MIFQSVTFNSTVWYALLVHATILKTVHILCDRVSENQFQNAARIWYSCPNFVSFSFYPPYSLKRTEDSLLLFERLWNCPNLKELELIGFGPYWTGWESDLQ